MQRFSKVDARSAGLRGIWSVSKHTFATIALTAVTYSIYLLQGGGKVIDHAYNVDRWSAKWVVAGYLESNLVFVFAPLIIATLLSASCRWLGGSLRWATAYRDGLIATVGWLALGIANGLPAT